MNREPQLIPLSVDPVVQEIQKAQSIVVSTHRQCDGDGLGAMLGLYHALKKTGKTVRAITVDQVPKKYQFLEHEKYVQAFEGTHDPIESADLALIFDTNDHRLVDPLYSELAKKCKKILFIDHHPLLNFGPTPTAGSLIDTRAASTGEIAYFIIRELGIHWDEKMAQSIYTSVSFDTQLFRFVKNTANSHLIAADILQYLKHPEEVHMHLFATHSVDKIGFLAKVLSQIEYYANYNVAVLKIPAQELKNHRLEMDDARDLIDMVMNIHSVQAAALFREDGPNDYKLSLRSKGEIEILGVAESFEGGGHLYAAGARILGPYQEARDKVVDLLLARIDNDVKTKAKS